jgi:hypothetical protein
VVQQSATNNQDSTFQGSKQGVIAQASLTPLGTKRFMPNLKIKRRLLFDLLCRLFQHARPSFEDQHVLSNPPIYLL